MNIKVSPEDMHILAEHPWHINSGGYVQSRTILLHRLIMRAPTGSIVDHANGDKLDNRRENLRFCTHQQNMQNSKVRSHSATGVKGVQKHRNKYRAKICMNGRQVLLGSFDTVVEAKACYDQAAADLFKDFARN